MMKYLFVVVLLAASCTLSSGCVRHIVTVRGADGRTMSGVKLEVVCLTKTTAPVYTDDKGRVEVEHIEQELVWLCLSKPDYGENAVPWPKHWPATVTFPRGRNVPTDVATIWEPTTDQAVWHK